MSYNSAQFRHYLETESDPQVKGSVLQDWSDLTHTDTHTYIYKTAPNSVNFRNQSQVQSFTGDSVSEFPTNPTRRLINFLEQLTELKRKLLLTRLPAHFERYNSGTATRERCPGQGLKREDSLQDAFVPKRPQGHLPGNSPNPRLLFFFFFPGGSII